MSGNRRLWDRKNRTGMDNSIEESFSMEDWSQQSQQIFSSQEASLEDHPIPIAFSENSQKKVNNNSNQIIQSRCLSSSSKLKEKAQSNTKNKQIKDNQHQNFNKQTNIQNTLRLLPLVKLKAFLNQIGSINDTPGIKLYILEYYTLLSPAKINETINSHVIESKIKQRIQKLRQKKRPKRWDKDDVICLIWIVSKIVEYKKQQQSQSFILAQNDYKMLNQIFQNAQPKCKEFLQKLRLNKYTDKWKNQQSLILIEICNDYLKNHQSINWNEISDQLLLKNKSYLAYYRCPIQCQVQWTRLQEGRYWTAQEDEKLLTLAYFDNNQQPNWKKIVHFFQRKSQEALKARFYILIQKLKEICSNSDKLTTLQLLRQKVEKRINLGNVPIKQKMRQNFIGNYDSQREANKKPYSSRQLKINQNSCEEKEEDIQRHRKTRQLIIELQNHIEDASQKIKQLKRLDQSLNEKLYIFGNGTDQKQGITSLYEERGQIRKRGRKKILTYKKGKIAKQFEKERGVFKKNKKIDKHQFPKSANRVVYKCSDFEVVRELNSQSDQAYEELKRGICNENDSKSSDNF